MEERQTSPFFAEHQLPEDRKALPGRAPFPHQNHALEKLDRWYEAAAYPGAGGILVLPTGGGKTFTALRFLCRGPLSDGCKVLWLAHTHHLLEQAFENCRPDVLALIREPRSKLSIRVVSGTIGHSRVHQMLPTDDMVVATLQSITHAHHEQHPALLRFLESTQGRLCVVFDEAHHSPAPSYRRLIEDLRRTCSKMLLLGLTATPVYSDEKKQGWLKKLFPQGLIHQATTSHLIADSVLAQPCFEKPRTNVVPEFTDTDYRRWLATYQDLPETLISELANNQERNEFIATTYVADRKRYGKTIIFADRWFQCEAISEALQARGIRAGAVYSHVDADPGGANARNRRDKSENARVLDQFRRGDLDVLLNVRMLTEGTDVPDVQTVFLTRQTTSRILYTQMVGRALRGPKRGGTEKAFIVSFVDEWKQAINWAEYDQPDGGVDGSTIDHGKRPPLQLISIDLVQRLARQLDSGRNVAPLPFLSLLPVGWYRAEYDACEEGSDDVEARATLVMVFEGEEESYRNFIAELAARAPASLATENATLDQHRAYLDEVASRFFPDAGERPGANLGANLFHVARHVAQREGEAPRFFAFGDRKLHDLDVLAQRFMDLPQRKVVEALRHEYAQTDRFWREIYLRFDLFKSQYDACVNRLLLGDPADPPPGPPGPGPGPPPNGEPSEQLKQQVKDRDGNRCLACGEASTRLLQVDHVAPTYFGGDNSLRNLQTLCRVCNQQKKTQTINFVNHVTSLDPPPSWMVECARPDPEHAADPDRWEQFLRRSVNFFFGCAAVDSVRIGRKGEGYYGWEVVLYAGNNPTWLAPYLPNLVAQIQAVRALGAKPSIKRLAIAAPDASPAAWEVADNDVGEVDESGDDPDEDESGSGSEGDADAGGFLSLPFEEQLDCVHLALLGRGPLRRAEAVRIAAFRLREEGQLRFVRLRGTGPIYRSILAAIEGGLGDAVRFDKPGHGLIRAIWSSAAEYPEWLWQRCLLWAHEDGPVERDEAVRIAADWAVENLGLQHQKLRPGGHVDSGLRKAMTQCIRKKLLDSQGRAVQKTGRAEDVAIPD